MKGVIAALWLCLATVAAGAQGFSAYVTSVVDGDTLIVTHGNRRSTVRLADIDAPEINQTFGSPARDSLAASVLHKQVWVNPRATDDYGRLVATVHLGKVNVNELQLRRGMAWAYSRHHANHHFKQLEREARRARRGLWARTQPQPPWVFRKSAAHAHMALSPPGSCGKKRYCSQMVSCDEARFYFTHCRVKTLDKNGDGTPCASLCASGAK